MSPRLRQLLETLRLPPIDSAAAVKMYPFDANEPLVVVRPTQKLIVQSIYQRAGVDGASGEIWLRRTVVERLFDAAARIPDGVTLALVDGWRSAELQRALYSRIADPKYAFNLDVDPATVDFPTQDAPHRTGGAVDVVLLDSLGFPLSMGSDFDDPRENSHTAVLESKAASSDVVTKDAILLRRLLFHVMRESGFSNYTREWWHYDFGNAFWRHFGHLQDGPVYRTVEALPGDPAFVRKR